MRLNEIDKPLVQADIDQLELFADRLFGKVGIDVEFTNHFLDRVNDERNIKPITQSELTRLFKQEFKRWGKPIAQMGPDVEAVMKDLQTNINMPFVLRWDPINKELDLIAKTVMRKPNFKTSNKEFAVEDFQKNFSIVEGGAMPGVGAIHISEIEPTLAELEQKLGINMRDNVLGSVGKREFSGDIDVALQIDREQIPEFLAKLKSTPEIKDIAQSSVIMTKVQIKGYDANKTDGRPRTGFVQVDFMPGDPGWLKTYYHSPHEKDSKYKGVFRNLMLAAIAGIYNRQDSPEQIDDGRPAQSQRYMWSPSDGLIRVMRTPVPKKSGDGYTKKNANKIIGGPFKTPDEIAQNLGLDNGNDLDSFESLLTAIKKNYPQDIVNKITSSFLENPTVKDIGIPSELA